VTRTVRYCVLALGSGVGVVAVRVVSSCEDSPRVVPVVEWVWGRRVGMILRLPLSSVSVSS